jgi:hypothetical protein
MSQGKWDVAGSNRKKSKKKAQLKATRQSSRLRGHGGIPVEELATKRKQKLNLERLGNDNNLSFAILNNVEDESLIKTAEDVAINLAPNKEGCKAQTGIKA